MTIETFGVTYTTLQQHCFPRLDVFSATTSPTATTVTTKIQVAAARLAAALAKEKILAATIVADTLSAAYLICADVVRKTAALDCRIPADDGDTLTRWQKELDSFFAELEEDAGTALANAALTSSASPPNGPTTHLTEYDLSIDDTTDMSDSRMPLHSKDEL